MGERYEEDWADRPGDAGTGVGHPTHRFGVCPREAPIALIGTDGSALAFWADSPTEIAFPVALLIVFDTASAAGVVAPDGPETAQSTAASPLPAENPQVGGLLVMRYFFLPWFLTASIAAAAASGSR